MAYDMDLAERVQSIIDGYEGVKQKKMFGGVCWTLHGNMCVGIHRSDLVVRVGITMAEQLLNDEHARPMDITGRPMKGWLFVSLEGCGSDEELAQWVHHATDFVRTLKRKVQK